MTTFIPAKGSKELKCRQDKIDDNLPVVIKKKKKHGLPSDSTKIGAAHMIVYL